MPIKTVLLLPFFLKDPVEHLQHHRKLEFGFINFVPMDNKGNMLGQETKNNPLTNTFSYEIHIIYI